jgi:hypothetical protein
MHELIDRAHPLFVDDEGVSCLQSGARALVGAGIMLALQSGSEAIMEIHRLIEEVFIAISTQRVLYEEKLDAGEAASCGEEICSAPGGEA